MTLTRKKQPLYKGEANWFTFSTSNDTIYCMNYMMTLTCEQLGPVLLIYASHVSHLNMWDIHANFFKPGMDVSHVFMVAINHLFVLLLCLWYILAPNKTSNSFMPMFSCLGWLFLMFPWLTWTHYQFSLCSRSRSYEMV
jgi:hypothetical protein